jgi:uncharacterized protein YjbJ (UPF0337 family)
MNFEAIVELSHQLLSKDRIKGSAEQAKGVVKEVAGKVTGDKKLSPKGRLTRSRARFRTLSAA